MIFNWLDLLLSVIIVVTLILGIIKGFIKQIIGLAAVVIGIVLAVNAYEKVGEIIHGLLENRLLSHLLAFLMIFFGILALGGLISWGLSKLIKGPFKAMNRILGAGLGLIKGLLIGGVLVFAFLIFPVDKNAIRESRIAPFSLKIIRAVYYLIPKDQIDKFNEAYKDIMGEGEKDETTV